MQNLDLSISAYNSVPTYHSGNVSLMTIKLMARVLHSQANDAAIVDSTPPVEGGVCFRVMELFEICHHLLLNTHKFGNVLHMFLEIAAQYMQYLNRGGLTFLSCYATPETSQGHSLTSKIKAAWSNTACFAYLLSFIF